VGGELRPVSDDVIEDLDLHAEQRATAVAREGLGPANEAGLDAKPLVHRVVAAPTERDEVTVWQAVLDVADSEDAGAIVLGSRGRSGLRSMLLGSVAYGLAHNRRDRF
jgi:nucleotide-binding universal stress UspA family protein